MSKYNRFEDLITEKQLNHGDVISVSGTSVNIVKQPGIVKMETAAVFQTNGVEVHVGGWVFACQGASVTVSKDGFAHVVDGATARLMIGGQGLANTGGHLDIHGGDGDVYRGGVATVVSGHVTAHSGSIVTVYPTGSVTARAGSVVFAKKGADVKADSGADIREA